MSTYLEMWARVRELTLMQTDDWIRMVRPARGRVIPFRGIKVIDVDVLEALTHHRENLVG
jgi:hypothetical protein